MPLLSIFDFISSYYSIRTPKGVFGHQTPRSLGWGGWVMSRYFNGFSLIELMIVIVIVAILGTIAYPSYQQYTRTSHRVEAKAMLLNAANRQEIYFMDFNQYVSSAVSLNIPDNSESGFYHLVISAGANTFILFASASGAQVADSDCIVFSIDQDGTRSATRLDDTVNDSCWN